MQLKPLTISTIQMVSGSCLENNLKTAERLIIEAKKSGAQMVLLPEYFAIMPLNEQDKTDCVEKHLDGKVQRFLASLANQYSLWIIGGTHPLESDTSQRPYGRCYVFNPNGECVCWYDKIHLFDVNVNDKKGSYQESKYNKAGDKLVSFATPWGKVGLAVCYDLRFPELFRELTLQGVQLFLIPAAFTYATGKVHWEILLKARAIENLCFVVASAQGGTHQNGRETWGHSCIISPWGESLSSLAFGEAVATYTLDFNHQQKLRNEFPVLSHRRL